tara:strand:- start:13044 stop:14513 length:1470 start_codon:yes stop_codon:yes gene_type:complete
LGCGRGEWLELLGDHGYKAQGVDIDDTMLSACRDLGLTVTTSDAIEFVKRLPDASQLAVSGFHIVEHIPFSELHEIVSESLRVLVPGGLLILETPNPENIVVGSCSFYLDPTHERPIPPLLLAFLPEYAGFNRTKILRLQQSPEILSNPSPDLLSVLNGVSPDYAVVAQKDGPAGLLEACEPAFEVEYGVTLEALAAKYQQATDARIADAESCSAQAKLHTAATASLADEIRNQVAKAEARATQAEARAAKAEAHAAQAEARAAAAESCVEKAGARAAQAEGYAASADARATEAEFHAAKASACAVNAKAQIATVTIRAVEGESLESRSNTSAAAGLYASEADARISEDVDVAAIEARAAAAETRAIVAETRISDLLNSSSWRVTSPLRRFKETLRCFNISGLRPRSRVILQHAILYVRQRPWLKVKLLQLVNRFPVLKSRLLDLSGVTLFSSTPPSPATPPELAQLTPRARKIYMDLQSAIADRKRVS